MNSVRKSKPKHFVRNCLLVAAMAVPIPAFATLRNYVGIDSGNWSTNSNWSPAAFPVNGDDVWSSPSVGDRNVFMDVNYVSPGIATLNLDGQNFSTATVTQNALNLIVSGNEQIGVNVNNRGRYIQNGGNHTIGQSLFLGLTTGSSGSYDLSGSAVLNVNATSTSNTVVGGSGSGIFTQTGGTHNVYGLQVGARFPTGQGNYSISNGTINATVITIGDPGNGYFTQTGGTVNALVLQTGVGGSYTINDGNLNVTNALINNSNFNLSHGSVSATVTNNGVFGITGGGLTVTGTGFANNGAVNLSGGTILLNAALTNNSQIIFYNNATISTSGSSPFNNLGLLTQGNGLLTLSAPTNNSGNITLGAGGGLSLSIAALTNTGTISLGGGRISGTGASQLTNRFGATITGSGLISSAFDNQGGRLLLTDGTTLITNAFNNSGVIQLTSDAASLSGGAITNAGEITGHGSIGNQVSGISGGMVEANGGTLILGGVVNNGAGGIISAPSGGKILIPGGMSTSGGLINLSGGTFDNNANILSNTGQISGFGTLRSGGLTNNGSITFTGGFTNVFGNVTNAAGRQIKIAYNPALFSGTVTNNGIIKTTSTTATFSGTYIENGTLISDPSDNYFMDVTLGGTWTGGVGDHFFVKGVLDWIAGAMTGTGGTTYNQGGTALHEAAGKTLSGWTFNNEKPLTMTGGNIDMGNNALINNTNTFDIQSDSGITNTIGGAATFANHATLRKSAGAGTSSIAAMVTHDAVSGGIDVQTGTLSLQGGLTIATAQTLQKTGAGTLRVSGPQPHGANSNLNILAGNVRLASDSGAAATGAAAAATNLNVNVTGNNTALILESSEDLKSLTVPFANAGNQSLDLNTPATPGTFNAIRVYAADLATAKLNLWAAIKNANAPGSLTPNDGIFDSSLPANHSNTKIGLALIADAHGDSHVQIRRAKIGDINLDNTVSIADFIDLAAHFNQSGPNITWQEGDINYDGTVSIADFIDLASQFNTTYSADDTELVASFAQSLGIDPSIIGSAVPEPGIALALATFLLALRRRRSK
jgi:hypothetical protein